MKPSNDNKPKPDLANAFGILVRLLLIGFATIGIILNSLLTIWYTYHNNPTEATYYMTLAEASGLLLAGVLVWFFGAVLTHVLKTSTIE